MKQYVEGDVYIIYVRQFGLPASNPESYYVRARCIGGNDLNIGYFEDSKCYRFNSCIDRATLERDFVWDREIIDIHPFQNPHARKHSESEAFWAKTSQRNNLMRKVDSRYRDGDWFESCKPDDHDHD